MNYLRGVFLLFMSFFIVESASAAQSDFTYDFDQTGYFYRGIAGLGLFEDPVTHNRENETQGTVSMNVQANPLKGIVYWHGYGPSYWSGVPEAGNSNVTFNGNAVTGTALPQGSGGEYGVGFKADVTQYLSTGTHNYTLGNVSFYQQGNSSNKGINNGFSVVSVSEDTTNNPNNYGRLVIASGSDEAWHGFTGNNGPNTGVFGINFNPVDYDRQAQITLIIAGGEDKDSLPGIDRANRPNYLWSWTASSGAIPASLVHSAGTRYSSIYPAAARSGYDWDNYSFALDLPANVSRLALQMESENINNSSSNGESFSWVGASIFLPEEAPIIVPEPASIGILSLLLPFVLRRKFLRRP